MPSLTTLGRLAALLPLVVAPSLASAHDVSAGSLVIRHPWARATPGGAQVGGGYLTVENKGPVPDRLVGGSFAASAGFSLHSMTTEGGIMRMRPTGPLDIPAGGAVTLDPVGRHIMFTGLTRGLKQGERVPGTLVFDHAGTVPVEFDVEGIGTKGPATDKPASASPSMPGMDMGAPR